MKKLISVTLLLSTTCCFAGNNTADKTLIDEFLQASRIQQVLAAQNEGYIQEMTQGMPSSAKEQMSKYVEGATGWNAIGTEYAQLVGNTFTSDELKAQIKFIQSPAGHSIAEKNIEFSRKIGALSAQKSKSAMSNTDFHESISNQNDKDSSTPTEFSITELNEQNVEGRTYFIGKVTNLGKSSARGVSIEVNLFLGGKFVDQYSTYISGAVPAEGSRYFKVSCGCKDTPPAKHDSYKVAAIESY